MSRRSGGRRSLCRRRRQLDKQQRTASPFHLPLGLWVPVRPFSDTKREQTKQYIVSRNSVLFILSYISSFKDINEIKLNAHDFNRTCEFPSQVVKQDCRNNNSALPRFVMARWATVFVMPCRRVVQLLFLAFLLRGLRLLCLFSFHLLFAGGFHCFILLKNLKLAFPALSGIVRGVLINRLYLSSKFTYKREPRSSPIHCVIAEHSFRGM
jgi:hypothetical protein